MVNTVKYAKQGKQTNTWNKKPKHALSDRSELFLIAVVNIKIGFLCESAISYEWNINSIYKTLVQLDWCPMRWSYQTQTLTASAVWTWPWRLHLFGNILFPAWDVKAWHQENIQNAPGIKEIVQSEFPWAPAHVRQLSKQYSTEYKNNRFWKQNIKMQVCTKKAASQETAIKK